MKKINKIIGLALLAALTFACTAEQDTEPIGSPDGYPLATFTPAGTYATINEGDTIVYNVEIDKPIERAITFSARIVGGDADDHDFIVEPGVLSPYTKSTQILVIFNQDWDAETDEELQLEFGAFSIADRYLPNQNTANPTLNTVVKNYVSDELIISLDWSQEFAVEEIIDVTVDVGTYETVLQDTVSEIYDLADEVDYDFYVASAEGFDINDPYATEIGNYTAATGNSPEELIISGLEDGEYVIFSDLYRNYVPENDYYSLADSTQKISVSAHFTRQGTDLDLVINEDPANTPLIYTTGYSPAATRNYVNNVIARVTVSGGKYTITGYNGTPSGPWKKSASINSSRPLLKKNW